MLSTISHFWIFITFIVIPLCSTTSKINKVDHGIRASGNDEQANKDLWFVYTYDKTTHIHVTLSGRGFRTTYLNDESSFQIQLALSPLHRSQSFLSSINVSDAFIMVRFVSAKYIVGADVERQQRQQGMTDKSTFLVRYSIRDFAKYFLQIRITWLSGSGVTDAIFPLKNTTAGVFLNHSHYLDAVIYSKSIELLPDKTATSEAAVGKGMKNSTSVDSLKPLCAPKSTSIAGIDKGGRWVYVNPQAKCPDSVCAGKVSSLAWLTDKFFFNNGYVWSPHSCNYHIFGVHDVERCFAKKNITSIAFTGDSLVREHFQNMLTLLLPAENIELQKLREDAASVNIVLPNGHDVRVDYYVMPNQWGRAHKLVPTALNMSDIKAHLINVHTYRIQAACGLDTTLAATVDSHFAAMLRKLKQYAIPVHTLTFLVGPRIQHEDIRVNRKRLTEQRNTSSIPNFVCMTNKRQNMATAAVLRNLESHGLHYLDALEPTTPRWEASWDGIHYSLLLNDQSLWRFNGTHHLPQVEEHCTAPYWRGKREAVACYGRNNNYNNASSTGGGGSGGVESGGGTSLSSITTSGSLDSVKRSTVDSHSNVASGVFRRLRLKEHPGINKCSHYNGGDMLWCRNVASINKRYHSFEGGVSRMLTMMWINRICADE